MIAIHQPKWICFRGTKYWRKDRYYFNTSKKRKFSNLHRAIYTYYKGEIPEGFHVHHIDGNTFNNNPTNLQAMDGREHNSLHSKLGDWVTGGGAAKALNDARPKLLEWIRSDEGREFYRKQGQDMQANRKPKEVKCRYCNEMFFAKNHWSAIFCSDKCKNRCNHNYEGVTEKPCRICGALFTGSSHTKYCTKSCGNKFRKRRAKALKEDVR